MKQDIKQAAVMIIVEDGLILSVSRRNNTAKFGLPGGRSEERETPEETAIRETYEETGIVVHECECFFVRHVDAASNTIGKDAMAYCFWATVWEGEPHSTEEGVIAWLSEEDLVGERGAFPDYNRASLSAFKTRYPNALKGK